jgi:hypothetical protein
MMEMHTILKTLLVCALGCFFTGGVATSQSRRCSQDEAIRAETATDKLKTWNSVYGFYKQFSHCDDGSIGEGISDAVAKLLANGWQSFGDFVQLASKDKAFESFVIRHVDETIDWNHDAPKIHQNARIHCPSNAVALCKLLIDRTTPEKQ